MQTNLFTTRTALNKMLTLVTNIVLTTHTVLIVRTRLETSPLLSLGQVLHAEAAHAVSTAVQCTVWDLTNWVLAVRACVSLGAGAGGERVVLVAGAAIEAKVATGLALELARKGALAQGFLGDGLLAKATDVLLDVPDTVDLVSLDSARAVAKELHVVKGVKEAEAADTAVADGQNSEGVHGQRQMGCDGRDGRWMTGMSMRSGDSDDGNKESMVREIKVSATNKQYKHHRCKLR
jgi:hypothetical protein